MRDDDAALIVCSVFAILLFTTLLITDNAEVTFLVDPTLHVSGTDLVDGDGNVVQLRSTLVDGNERTKKQGTTSNASNIGEAWFQNSDVETLKSYRGNCFEVHADRFNRWSTTRGVLNDSWFTDWVDYWVSWGTVNQLYVILNLCPFNYNYEYTIPDWIWEDAGYGEPTNQAEWDAIIRDFFDTDVAAMDISRQGFIDVWKAVATRYKNDDSAIFSIMDEPFLAVDKNGDDAHLGETYSEFMEDVVDGIHSTGATNIIMIDRPILNNWATHTDPVNKTGIAWRTAYYMSAGTNYTTWCGYIDSFADKFMGDFGKPYFNSGFGFSPQSDSKNAYPSTWQTHLQNMRNYLEAKSTCGICWHAYGYLDGEYYDYTENIYTGSESATIMNIAFWVEEPPAPEPPIPPEPEPPPEEPPEEEPEEPSPSPPTPPATEPELPPPETTPTPPSVGLPETLPSPLEPGSKLFSQALATLSKVEPPRFDQILTSLSKVKPRTFFDTLKVLGYSESELPTFPYSLPFVLV